MAGRSTPPPSSGPPSPDRRRLLIALGYAVAGSAVLSRIGAPDGDRTEARVLGATLEGPDPEARKDPPSLEEAIEPPPPDHVFERVISGGRVVDPATGFDAIADVGIDGGIVGAISLERLQGRTSIDAVDKVVAPGFIDILSYEPEDTGAFLKLADGVTTNLGMQGINAGATEFLDRFTDVAPVHFGGAFDHPFWRGEMFGLGTGEEASDGQIEEMAAELERQLQQGWIGVDFEPEYVPATTFREMTALAEVAARYDVPCFVHGRYSAYGTNARTLDEIVAVAEETGARVHVEHIISTGGTFAMAESLARLDAARAKGNRITACMYPYDFWATYLGSARFSPGWQERFRISYEDLQIAGTTERLTAGTFARHQSQNHLAAAYAIPEEDVQTCLRSPFVMIGSDAIFTTGNNHPRATGCFARTLGRYVRDRPVLGLADALAKMTILPARLLEPRAPSLRRKGRLQQGADADVCVFDPRTIIDRSTVEDPSLPSAGIEWVLVGGQVAKTPDGVDQSVRAGQPIRFEPAP